VILCFAGDIASHRRCKREEEEEADLDLPWRRSFLVHAPPVVAASGADAPPPLPQFLRGCSAVPRLFRDFFCNFYMFEYVFKFLLNVLSLCSVVKIVTEKNIVKKWCVSVCLYFYLLMLLNYKKKKNKKN